MSPDRRKPAAKDRRAFVALVDAFDRAVGRDDGAEVKAARAALIRAYDEDTETIDQLAGQVCDGYEREASDQSRARSLESLRRSCAQVSAADLERLVALADSLLKKGGAERP